MEIRDPVHGSINILDEEIDIIINDFFQRLRNIKQLGLSDYAFPGATHTRFLHSVGVMEVGTKTFNKVFKDKLLEPEFIKLRETFRLACLLHDIGHAPLSHSTETVMPQVEELNIPPRFITEVNAKNRKATHEDYTIKIITDSSLTKSFEKVSKKYNVDVNCIAELIIGVTSDQQYFTVGNINYFPILHQLISSELDCDRMDYLLRDSYFCGVSYGNYDLDWLIDNLDICIVNNTAYLGVSERAVVTFDDFLLSRFHMFLMVYFHYRSVCLEQLLFKFFDSAPLEYTIPSDIEEYLKHDDHFLMKIMRKSSNKYANAVVKNKIPEKIYESFNEEQLMDLEKIQTYLKSNNIEYIRCSSSGRLSKYYTDNSPSEKYLMKVYRKTHNSDKKILFEINEATDLFQKFSKSHAVNRIHCDFNRLSNKNKQEIENMIAEKNL